MYYNDLMVQTVVREPYLNSYNNHDLEYVSTAEQPNALTYYKNGRKKDLDVSNGTFNTKTQ